MNIRAPYRWQAVFWNSTDDNYDNNNNIIMLKICPDLIGIYVKCWEMGVILMKNAHNIFTLNKLQMY